jgi:NADPH:quinone reductase
VQALQISAPASDSRTTNVVEMDEPTPGPGQVTIDVAYAGINFMDVMTRRGDAGYAPAGWPLVPGLEVSGTIRAVGPNVAVLCVGDRVAAQVTQGGFAEVALADSALVAAVPPNLDLSLAAAAPLMLSTAVLLLREVAQVRAGDRLFMHAASGGVGSVVPQVARSLGVGLRVGSVADRTRMELATAAGWDSVIAQGDSLTEAAMHASEGLGYDIVLDPTGTTSLDLDLALAAPGARIVLFGNATGGTPQPLPAFGRLLGGNIGLFGFSITSLRRTRPERVADALSTGLAMIDDGQVHPSVTVIDSLSQIGAVHNLLAQRAGRGKYVACIGTRGNDHLRR